MAPQLKTSTMSISTKYEDEGLGKTHLFWNHLHCQTLARTPWNRALTTAAEFGGILEMDRRQRQKQTKKASCHHQHTTPSAQRRMSAAAKATKWECRRCKWSGVRGRWVRYRWCADRLQLLKWLMEETAPPASFLEVVFRRRPQWFFIFYFCVIALSLLLFFQATYQAHLGC